MNAHHIKIAIAEDGKLSLQDLPFNQGDEVEIVIIKRKSSKKAVNSHSLTGTVISYENPFEPAISPDDWEALA